ncbi:MULTISPECIES: hypothetical protein [Mesorhizobium]|uniref:hypothetical protein n=1 Tax=Mesorhizobium TaxID=68287 RepID=UPI00117C7855|nr:MULTISPECIES: hypothetical protein [Mesorhizobium]
MNKLASSGALQHGLAALTRIHARSTPLPAASHEGNVHRCPTCCESTACNISAGLSQPDKDVIVGRRRIRHVP